MSYGNDTYDECVEWAKRYIGERELWIFEDTALRAALAQEQVEPVREPVSEMLVDDLCLLHLGWKPGADGDLHRDIYHAAMDRVIARAIKVRGLRKIKQLEGKA